MPMDWVEPDEVLRANGVSVYRAYKDDLYSRPLRYSFTTDVTERASTFDVRDLEAWKTFPLLEGEGEEAYILRVLKVALEAGELPFAEDE
jgi:hypothetical protein